MSNVQNNNKINIHKVTEQNRAVVASAIGIKRAEAHRPLTDVEKKTVASVERELGSKISFDNKGYVNSSTQTFTPNKSNVSVDSYGMTHNDRKDLSEVIRLKRGDSPLSKAEQKKIEATESRLGVRVDFTENGKIKLTNTNGKSGSSDIANGLSEKDRTLLNKAIELKTQQKYRALSESEINTVRNAESHFQKTILVNDKGRVRFAEPQTASAYFKRDASLAKEKRSIESDKARLYVRKNDYVLSKGLKTKEQKWKDKLNKFKQSGSLSANIKSVGKAIDKVAMASVANESDVGVNTVAMSYSFGKNMVLVGARVTALNMKLAPKAVDVSKKTFKVGKKAYTVGKSLGVAFQTGTLKKQLAIYGKSIGDGVKRGAIYHFRYSPLMHKLRNARDSVKIGAKTTVYAIKTTGAFIKGIKNGTLVLTKKDVGSALKKAGGSIAKGGIKAVKHGVVNVGTSGALKGGINVVNMGADAVKSTLAKSGDVGSQSVATMVTVAQNTGNVIRGGKLVGKTAVKTGKTVAKAGVKTVRGGAKTVKGTVEFVKNVKKFGFKTSTKLWYKMHLKGAGKKIAQKLAQKVTQMIAKLISTLITNPYFWLIMGVVLGAVLIVSACSMVVGATTGGVVEAVEELVEELGEAVEKVADTISNWWDGCVDWVKSLFTDEDEIEESLVIDVDIGDSISVCEFILGSVQIYKRLTSVEIKDSQIALIDDYGYHGFIIKNSFTGSSYYTTVAEIVNPEEYLATDREYVTNIVPAWRSYVLGYYGENYSGQNANAIARLCYNNMTLVSNYPSGNLDRDNIAEYEYCDGTVSYNEGDNFCVTKIGGMIQSGITFGGFGSCLNESDRLYHAYASDNIHGIACDTESYWCGGHSRYVCQGHELIQFCEGDCEEIADDADDRTCTGHYRGWYYCDAEIELESPCENSTLETYYCYSGTNSYSSGCSNEMYDFYCSGYNLCLGHRVQIFSLGTSKSYDDLVNKLFNRTIEGLEHEKGIGLDWTEEDERLLISLRSWREMAKVYNKDGFIDPTVEDYYNSLNPE